MSQLRLRPLGFGEILDGAFTLYRHNFAVFFITALLSVIPITLVTRLLENASLSAADPAAAAAAGAVMFLLIPVSMVLWALLWGALTQQTARAYEGEPPSVGAGYGRSIRSLGVFLASWFIVMGITLVVVFALTIVLTIASIPLAAAAGSQVATIGAAVIGVAMFVGAMAAFTSVFAVVPAIIVEKLGPWNAIKRSHALARGGRLRIIGVAMVSFLIVLLPTVGLMVAAGMGTAMWDVTVAATLSPMQRLTQLLVGVLSSALTTPFMVGCFTLLYFDRRIRAEGYDLEVAADALAANAVG